MLWVRPPLRERSTTLFDKVCEWLAASRWFSPGPPVSSNNKTDRHYILEILLNVTLTTIQPTNQHLLIKLLNNNTTICAFCISIHNKLKQQWFIYLWYAKISYWTCCFIKLHKNLISWLVKTIHCPFWSNIMIIAQSCTKGRQLVYHSCQVSKYRSGKTLWHSH
jgi:hypothetical protein